MICDFQATARRSRVAPVVHTVPVNPALKSSGTRPAWS